MIIEENELKRIIGGAISATLLSAIIRGLKLLIDFGRALGTAVRRICSKTVCPA